jgi:hypothetical protein
MKSADEAMPLACSPKLPDLDSKLASVLEPLAEGAICNGGSLFAWFICGGPVEPIGVAIRKAGAIGLPSTGTSCPSEVPFTTGRALGLGGIANPRAGFLGPALLLLEPGIGGRSSGAGLDIVAVVEVVGGREREAAAEVGGEGVR